jgi:hypothetical protein
MEEMASKYKGSCSCGLMARSDAPAWVLDVGLTNYHKDQHVMKCYTGPWT